MPPPKKVTSANHSSNRGGLITCGNPFNASRSIPWRPARHPRTERYHPPKQGLRCRLPGSLATSAPTKSGQAPLALDNSPWYHYFDVKRSYFVYSCSPQTMSVSFFCMLVLGVFQPCVCVSARVTALVVRFHDRFFTFTLCASPVSAEPRAMDQVVTLRSKKCSPFSSIALLPSGKPT